MSWRSMADFWAMGGYGLYVWGAYGVALLLMAVQPLLAWRRHRRALNAARQAGDLAP